MTAIFPAHISVLRLLVELIEKDCMHDEITEQAIKRLLVYSNVHFRNSMLHNLLLRAMAACARHQKLNLLKAIDIAAFMVKNKTEDHYAFMSLRKRVFRFWVEHQLT